MPNTEIPPCAAAMGCLCAGHARGDPASAECNTDELRSRGGHRTVQLKLMLTSEERERLHTEAAACGETASDYLRRAMREQMRRDSVRRGLRSPVRAVRGPEKP